MRRILCKNCSFEWETDDNAPTKDIKCPNCESMGTSVHIFPKMAQIATPFFFKDEEVK